MAKGWAAAGRSALLALLVLLPIANAPAQTLYDLWDRFTLQVKEPVGPVAPTGEVTLVAHNGYPTALHHLQVTLSSQAFVLEGAGVGVAVLPPDANVPLTFGLRQTSDAKGDTADLRLTVSCDEIGRPYTLVVSVPLTEVGAKSLTASQPATSRSTSAAMADIGRAAGWFLALVMIAVLLWLWLLRGRVGQAGEVPRPYKPLPPSKPPPPW